jgi:hypothetical protein
MKTRGLSAIIKKFSLISLIAIFQHTDMFRTAKFILLNDKK